VFDAAVAVGIAAFLEGDEPPTDATVTARLEDRGVEPWLAERLVAFLPLAFGRRLLTGVRLSDQFLDGPVERALADEPVYAAAAARAATADRRELERIALRRSEVDAVNQALHRGSRMEDLEGGPAALSEPLRPADPGDGGVPSPREAFGAFLAGHGFTVDGPRVGDVEFDARVFAHSTRGTVLVGQVDFAVRHPGLAAEWLLESFGGVGATWREVIGQCVEKFERASLHVIIAALLDRAAAADQVEWESYAHPAGPFDLCLGPQLTLYAPGNAPPAGPMLDRLLAALRDVPLSREVHWLRRFTCYQDGRLQTNEVLLDGEPWAAGETIAAAAPPPPATALIGVRMFGMLVPAPA